MKEGGQASIEFMFLISVAMLYIATVVLPAVEISRTAAEDVSQLAQTRIAAEKLANTIDSVAAASDDAKQTITLFVPARGQISCGASAISFDFLLTKANSNQLLLHTSCHKESSLTKGTCTNAEKCICSNSFLTVSTFSCSLPGSVGDIENANSTTVEAAITKTGSAIDVSFS